jgi:outer membrane lipoprotein-sorting protein
MTRAIVLTAAFLFLLVGCAPREKLPTVAWRDPSEALSILARRAESVKTVTAEGDITLQRPDGESVRLDLAMVRAGSESVRIRAWKLGQAVFDLTMTPEGAWLLTPKDASLQNKARSAGLSARKLAQNLALLGGDLFRQHDLTVRDAGNYLEVTSPVAADGTQVRCEVERRTLTPRRYVLLNREQVARFSMDLSDYSLIGDIPFARRYLAISDDGRIVIVLREVELNTELAESAFVHPRRAEKLP